MPSTNETIVAQATAIGIGAVAIVRVSGPKVTEIAQHILRCIPKPREAHYTPFYNNNEIVDYGIALYFKSPHSFSGEDVLELQGHGGPILVQQLIAKIIDLGARHAQPGEFSKQAFLNGKIDLTQAEAIADLIVSQSQQAARCALRSLQGEFSKQIDIILNQLINLRMYIESSIDFVDEEIELLNQIQLKEKLTNISAQLKTLIKQAQQGQKIRDGITCVIIGKPNVGKSSLLNRLAGNEVAIVTDIPGTTRDIIREQIIIDGLPIHIIDTAGIRPTADQVEVEGIKRALQQVEKADHILFMLDANDEIAENIMDYDLSSLWQALQGDVAMIENLMTKGVKATVVINKIDLKQTTSLISRLQNQKLDCVYLSAKTGSGIEPFKAYLKQLFDYATSTESNFIARVRHLHALQNALHHLTQAQENYEIHHATELLAEDLRQAQLQLSEITGKFTSDDLLGKIFSSFCIGK